MVKTISASQEAEFELMAFGLKCPMCRAGAKKEVYRCLGPNVFLVRCLNCEHCWKVARVFRLLPEENRA